MCLNFKEKTPQTFSLTQFFELCLYNRYHLFLENYFIEMLTAAKFQLFRPVGPILNHSFEYCDSNLANNAS